MTNWSPRAATRQRARRRSYRIPKLAWVLMIPFGIFAMPSLILLSIAMLPTFGALVSDRRTEKYAATCVGGFNLSATLPYLFILWSQGGGMTPLMPVLSDVWMYLVIYLVSAVGWGVYWAIPQIMTRVSNWHSMGEFQDLQKRKQELLDEWGVDLAQEVEKINSETKK
ncbi:MAG: hypothetical protein QM523_02170 [Candidatus Pacebacteria bacterium]|nr:hypothetical protein [Candidatus Paceibacterota bacterium]